MCVYVAVFGFCCHCKRWHSMSKRERELSWVCLILLLNERFTKVSHSANKWCFHLGLNAITICYRAFFCRDLIIKTFNFVSLWKEKCKKKKRKIFLIDFIIRNLISFYALTRNFFDLINNHAHTLTKTLIIIWKRATVIIPHIILNEWISGEVVVGEIREKPWSYCSSYIAGKSKLSRNNWD